MSAQRGRAAFAMNTDREYKTAIDDLSKHPDADDSDQDELHSLLWSAIPILVVIVATAVLYLVRDMLPPLAMATMLSVIFSPLAWRAEKVMGRFAGAAVVVLGAVAMVGAIGSFLTTELTSVGGDLDDYSENSAAKPTAIQKYTPSGPQRVESAIATCKKRCSAPVLKRRRSRAPFRRFPRAASATI
jgi:hypothetical protein